MAAHHAHHLVAHHIRVLPLGLVHEVIRTKIGRHDDQHVAEIHRAALTIGEAAIVQHLQQHIEDIGMRLLDFVEEHDLIGPAAYSLCERAALFIADIARRCADETGDRMLLHVFRHVEAHEGGIVVEQERRQRFGQLCLADTGGPEEHEGTDGAIGILQACTGAAYGG